MDARSFLFLATSLLLLRRTRADTCDVSISRRAAELDRELTIIACQQFTPPQWTWTNRNGSDLCTANTEYSRCSGKNLCRIPREDYLLEEFTFFCCHSPTDQQRRQCWQIIVNPIVNHTVPQLVRAGKEETVYSFVKAKPRPPKFPGVEVQLEMKTGNNTAFVVRQINSTIEVSPHPSLPLTYVAFHTFHVPLDANEKSTLRLHFGRPTDWNSTDDLVYPDIGVVSALEGTTAPGSGSPSTDGDGTLGEGTTVGTANCIEISTANISFAVVAAATILLLPSVICLSCWYKNKNKIYKSPVEVPSSSPTQPAPPPPVPDNLQIRPVTPNSNTNSTTTTPGLTPMGESTCLLSGSGGGVATDYVTGAHFRQHSRDSGSTTTTSPTEGDQLLASSTGLTVSTTGQTCITSLTGSSSSSCVPLPSVCRTTAEICKHYNGHLISGNYPPTSRSTSEIGDNVVVGGEMRVSSEAPANVPSGWGGGAKAKSIDPKHHVYSTVGETLKVEYRTVSHTLTTGTGLSSEHQSLPLSQMYQQGHEVNHVTLSTSSTLPRDNMTSILMFPPLPADKPEYASHGSKMHLHPQLTDNVSAV